MKPIKQEHLCPVCGFELCFEPWNGESASDEMCPSCGIQFGYDDAAGGRMEARHEIYRKWRGEWVKKGMPWSSVGARMPRAWEPGRQLKRVTRVSGIQKFGVSVKTHNK